MFKTVAPDVSITPSLSTGTIDVKALAANEMQ